MAASNHRPAPQAADLSSQSDFELLNGFMSLVCKEHSLRAKELACEIMRRYTVSRVERPFQTRGSSIQRGATWGDAKRVEQIFGIRRGPLDRIRRAGLIVSRSLEEDRNEDEPSAVRAKRLYDLISIEEYLRSPESKERDNSGCVVSPRIRKLSSTTKKKLKLKIMQK